MLDRKVYAFSNDKYYFKIELVFEMNILIFYFFNFRNSLSTLNNIQSKECNETLEMELTFLVLFLQKLFYF